MVISKETLFLLKPFLSFLHLTFITLHSLFLSPSAIAFIFFSLILCFFTPSTSSATSSEDLRRREAILAPATALSGSQDGLQFL